MGNEDEQLFFLTEIDEKYILHSKEDELPKVKKLVTYLQKIKHFKCKRNLSVEAWDVLIDSPARLQAKQ